MGTDRDGIAVGRLEYPRPPRLARHPVRLASRPVFLAGWERLLARLDDRLAVREEQPKPQVTNDPALMAAEFGELPAQIGALGLLGPQDPVASVPAEFLTNRTRDQNREAAFEQKQKPNTSRR